MYENKEHPLESSCIDQALNLNRPKFMPDVVKSAKANIFRSNYFGLDAAAELANDVNMKSLLAILHLYVRSWVVVHE